MSKFYRRMPEHLPPENVRLVSPSGVTYPCGVLREPGRDEDGCACWLAVPLVPLPPLPPHAFHMVMAQLPPNTILYWKFAANPQGC